MQRYIAQPLLVQCRDLEELRRFLLRCRYMSDKEQFGQLDYWNTPDDFEKRLRGDCDDFALWTWRQLIGMGYGDARFVVGSSGRYGAGHAWVQYSDHGHSLLLDPLRGHLSAWFPRLVTIRYRPDVSVAWSGNRLHYFEHEERVFNPPLHTLPRLVVEWLLHWVLTRPRHYFLVFRYLVGKLSGRSRGDGLTSRLSGPA
jgi:Bacterial transglutaminase-like cysteine proteinase BTLCP